ncbi:hypothetical protein [Pyrococcus kukulkanii]|uniref:hypothetical protein n=1 Tax=Pyrococcus kukulkanii TaxID=1609559 RepID=UPI0035633629
MDELERLRKLLKELEREYYEKCDGQGHDFNPFMQEYCTWLSIEIERLEKKIKEREGSDEEY